MVAVMDTTQSNVLGQTEIASLEGVRESVSATMNYLMVGHPGVGKSTLLNALAGKHVFESGVSTTGSGVTCTLQRYEDVRTRTVYIDIPGLSDGAAGEEAARAITQALRMPGSFRIFFVASQRYGRTLTEDKTMIKHVLLNAPCITSYGIILNQIPEMLFQTFESQTDSKGFSHLHRMAAALVSGLPEDRKTTHMQFLHTLEALEGRDNVGIQLPESLEKFIRTLPAIEVIDPNQVKDIGILDYALVEADHQHQRELEANRKQISILEETIRNANHALQLAYAKMTEANERADQAVHAMIEAEEKAKAASALAEQTVQEAQSRIDEANERANQAVQNAKAIKDRNLSANHADKSEYQVSRSLTETLSLTLLVCVALIGVAKFSRR